MAPCSDDKTNIACFRRRQGYAGQVAVFARRKNARSRADAGILRQAPGVPFKEDKQLGSIIGGGPDQ